jgi:hypothetical protein
VWPAETERDARHNTKTEGIGMSKRKPREKKQRDPALRPLLFYGLSVIALVSLGLHLAGVLPIVMFFSLIAELLSYASAALGTVVLPILMIVALIRPGLFGKESRREVLDRFLVVIMLMLFGSVGMVVLRSTALQYPPQGVLPRVFGSLLLLAYVGPFVAVRFKEVWRPLFKKQTTAILGVMAVLAVATAFASPQVDRVVADAAGPACSGAGVAGAAPYEPGARVHPAVLLSDSGERSEETDMLPRAWWPGAVSELELVVCLGEEEEERVERCQYEDAPVVERYQKVREVRVVAALSGETVVTDTVGGALPKPCYKATNDKPVTLTGTSVQRADVHNRLNRFVNP